MRTRVGVFLCAFTFVLSVAISYSATRPRCVRLESGQTVMRTVEWTYRPMRGWRLSSFRYVYTGSECLPGIGELNIVE